MIGRFLPEACGLTTENVAQNRVDTGGATRSRTGLIGFAIGYGTTVKRSAASEINDLRVSGITGFAPISHSRADFYQRLAPVAYLVPNQHGKPIKSTGYAETTLDTCSTQPPFYAGSQGCLRQLGGVA